MGKNSSSRKLAIISDAKKREEERRRREEQEEMEYNDPEYYEKYYNPYGREEEMYLEKAYGRGRGRPRGSTNRRGGNSGRSGGRGSNRQRDSRGRYKAYMPDMRYMYPDMNDDEMNYRYNEMDSQEDMPREVIHKHFMYGQQNNRNYPDMEEYPPITAGGLFWMDDKQSEKMNKLFKKVKYLDRETAEKWVSHMTNPEKDGKGGKWSFEQARGMMQQKKIDCDPIVFFTVLNMVWSDYYEVAKKYNVTNTEYFIDLAMAWIEDDDVKAGRYKTPMYYHLIVENCLEEYK